MEKPHDAPGAHAPPASPRRFWRERVVLLVLLLLGAALLAGTRLASRAEVRAQESARLQGQAKAVDENLVAQLAGAYAALQDARADLRQWPAGERAERASQRLQALCAAMPGVGTMAWLDASGHVRASNRPELRGRDESAQPYFQNVRQRPDAALLHVSEPYRNAVGEYSLNLSVALRNDQGGFDGLIEATLDPIYFNILLGSVNYAPDMLASVVSAAGLLVVVNPADEALNGLDLSRPGTLFMRHRDGGQPASVVEGPSQRDGAMRLAAWRTLQPESLPLDRPLVVGVSRRLDEVLAAWQRQTRTYALLYAAFAATALLALLARQRRRAELERLAAAQQARLAMEAERLALALRGADLALWDAHIPSGQGTVNDRWFEMLGYRRGEIGVNHRDWEALIHPDDRERVVAAQAAHIEGHSPGYDETYRLRHRDGHWVWVQDRGRAVERDAAGRALRMVGTHRDISASVQAEETLRSSEESLAITLYSIGDAVIATDREGRVTRLNATAERLLGWSAGQAQGQPLHSLFRIFNARTRERQVDPVALVLARGEVVGLANDTVLVARDGTEYQIADSAAPIRDGQGQIVGVVLVFSDVTERYRMLQALRDSEAQLATVAAALPGPVSRLDAEGRYLFANAAYERWFGVPVAQMLGRDCSEVVGSAAHALFEPWRLRAMAGETVTFDLAVTTLDGPRDTMVTVVPDRSSDPADAAVRGCFVVTTDISERKRAEEAQRQGERKLRALLDSLRSGVVVHGPDTVVLDANPAACQILGLTLEQMRGKAAVDPGWHFVEEDGTPMALARYPVRQVLDSGLPLRNLLGGIVRSDLPHVTWVLCNGFAVSGDDGVLQQVVVTFSDITERVQAQEEVQRSAARLRMAGRLARLGDWRLEVDGWRLTFSPELTRLLGADAASLSGADAAYDFVAPADRERWRAQLAQCLRDGQPFATEIGALAHGGSARHLQVLGEAVRDAGGRITALQGAVQDITERKQAEAAVLAAQQDLAATLAAVPDLLFDVDAEGCIHGHHSPRSELLALPPERFLGRRFADLLPAEAVAVASLALQQAQSQGHSSGLQYVLDLPQGQRWFELSVAPKPVAAGGLARFIVLARDVTERKQAEAERQGLERQLREAQKMESIGTLAGGIAHDFNNILAAILGNVALARGDLPEPHPALASLEQISKASLRARALVQQILTFSRRQRNLLVSQPLRPIVEETLALMRVTLPATVSLDTALAAEPLLVDADATQLQQVLMNLCTNAWHSLPAGRGHIEVGCEPLPADAATTPPRHELQGRPCVHLWVRDDGSGMDAATRERIFDPFFTTKAVGQGTGLGLSVVHGIVRGHGGAIVVDTAPGRGSTFHVYLPRAAERGAAREAAPVPATARPADGGQQVLYVDDDEVMVLMVQRLLERAGYRVTTSSSAAQALQRVREQPSRFDLVVSDHNMPESSGMELAAQLALQHPGLPVIISSGYLSDELRERAAQIGVRALLQKEHTLEELPALVHKVLAGLPAGQAP